MREGIENLDDWFAMPPEAAKEAARRLRLTAKGMAGLYAMLDESTRRKIPLEEWVAGAGLELGEVIEAARARRRDA